MKSIAFYNSRSNTREILIILSIFSLSWFSLLYFTGSLTSGYHLLDDHEVLTISQQMKAVGFWKALQYWVIKDFSIRFRPVNYFYLISKIYIFNADFFLMSLYTALLAVLTSTFLYAAARKFRFSIFESVAFTLLTLLGHQSAIWWRLGPAETFGMFFLSITFYLMSITTRPGKRTLALTLFYIFLVLMSWSKESFIVIIPALVYLHLFGKMQKFSLRKLMTRGLPMVAPALLLLIEVAIILKIGTNQIKYAGMVSSIDELLDGLGRIFLNASVLLHWWQVLFLLVILWIFSSTRDFKKLQSRFRIKVAFATRWFIFALLVVTSNVFLYAKSGMEERYLVPATMGLAILFVALVRSVGSKNIRMLMRVVIIGFLSWSFMNAYASVKDFSKWGHETRVLFDSMKSKAEKNSDILFVYNGSELELIYSLRVYLEHHGYSRIYGHSLKKNFENEVEAYLNQLVKGQMLEYAFEKNNDIPRNIVFFYPQYVEVFFNSKPGLRKRYTTALNYEGPIKLFRLKE